MIEVDVSDERFERGVPFDTFDELRDKSPVWFCEADQAWYITSHELVESVNRDFATFSNVGGTFKPGTSSIRSEITFSDPPEHTKTRRTVTRQFVPRSIANLESAIHVIAAEAITRYVDTGGGDFVSEVSSRITFRVIAELMGLPYEDQDKLTRWVNAIVPGSDPDSRPEATSMEDALENLSTYFGDIYEVKRRHPADDLLTQMLATPRGDELMSEDMLRNMGQGIMLAGIETSRNIMSFGLQVLLENDDVMRGYLDGDFGEKTMVEEFLRYITPVLQHTRWCLKTTDVGGKTIKEGDRVVLWMVAANRDPKVFANPHVFDGARTPNNHVSFGAGGPHYCLGVHLARLEIASTFEVLRPQLHRFELSGPPVRVRSNYFHSLKQLPVAVR